MELKSAVDQFESAFLKFSDEQTGALNKLKTSLELVRDSTKTKVRNATIAGAGFAISPGLAFAEQFSLIGTGDFCVAKREESLIEELIFPRAHGEGVKETVSANFDKIGIPIGAGVAAAYLAFEMQFLNPIFATGTLRGITFGVMSGLAGIAAYKMNEFAEYLDDQIKLIEDLIAAFQARVRKTDVVFDRTDTFLQFVQDNIIPQARRLLGEVDRVLDQIPN